MNTAVGYDDLSAACPAVTHSALWDIATIRPAADTVAGY